MPRDWTGSWNHWIAPFHACPRCGASLNWKQCEDVFDRPMIDAACCGITHSAPMSWEPRAASPETPARERCQVRGSFPDGDEPCGNKLPCAQHPPAAPNGAATPLEEDEPFDLAAQLNAFFNATQDGDEDAGERAQNAIADEFTRLASRLSETEAAIADLQAQVSEWRESYLNAERKLGKAEAARAGAERDAKVLEAFKAAGLRPVLMPDWHQNWQVIVYREATYVTETGWYPTLSEALQYAERISGLNLAAAARSTPDSPQERTDD
jgi:hypothetical protein